MMNSDELQQLGLRSLLRWSQYFRPGYTPLPPTLLTTFWALEQSYFPSWVSFCPLPDREESRLVPLLSDSDYNNLKENILSNVLCYRYKSSLMILWVQTRNWLYLFLVITVIDYTSLIIIYWIQSDQSNHRI